MKIKVPFYTQETDYTCGPAVLKMIFEFFGITKSEKWLAEQLNTNAEKGTSHEALIRIATDEGFYCYVNSNSDFFEIVHFIRLGLPVIVDFKEPTEEEGHYAVVIRISRFPRTALHLHDPYNGKDIKLSEKKFLARWYDPLTKSKKWIMVLAKEDFEVGKQYLPKK